MPDPAAWEDNDRLRREASAALARAASAAGALRLIQESVAFVYVDGGDAWLDKDAAVEDAPRTARPGDYTRTRLESGPKHGEPASPR